MHDQPCSDCGESPGRCRETGDFAVLVHDYGEDYYERQYS